METTTTPEPTKTPEPTSAPEPTKEEEYFEVVFETNGGSKIESLEVKKGDKVSIPKDPTKDGYAFIGWYVTSALKQEYDFEASVEKDIKLYAKWTESKKEEKPWSKASDWAVAELDKATTLNIIPEIFNKEDLTKNITRKEFAHVAVKLYEKLTGNKAAAVARSPFKDTDDVEVLKAYNLEITKGVSEDEFAPDTLITREQMATMMTRTLTKAGINTSVDLEKVKKFDDDAQMNDWGKPSIYYMSNIEIIKGMGDGTFGVLGNATREQALLISERSAEKFAKGS